MKVKNVVIVKQEWFAWYPVKLKNSKWVWWKKVFRSKRSYRTGSSQQPVRSYFIYEEVVNA